MSGDLDHVSSVALLPGSFHPVTVAHLALAEAALAHVERVLFVMPRSFPHKTYDGVALEDRVELLRRATEDERRFSVGLTEGGLFIEIARETIQAAPGLERVCILCGRDAAERIVNWSYQPPDSIESQLTLYELLVAAREGEYIPPRHLAGRIAPLPLSNSWDEVSATRIRHAIARQEPWEHLVPAAIRDQVKTLYSPAPLDSRNARSR